VYYVGSRGPDDVRPLPKSYEECDEKPEKKPPTGAEGGVCGAVAGRECAGSYGDPHLMTFDQLHYEFQAVGEFVNTRGEGLEVQARQEPFAGWSRTVSVTTAVAFRVGESRLNLVLANGDVAVRIDGVEVTPERGERALPGGGALVRQESRTGFGPDTYVVRWPDGSAAEVDTVGSWGLRLVLKLDRGRIGAVEGLYGDFDGDPVNDLTPDGGGKPLDPEPEFEPLYRVFGDSWRVRDDTSLFDYDQGQSTETFTDRSFPDEEVTVDGLDPAKRAEAEEICRETGVTARTVLADCVLDVAVTGQPDFAVASADTELVVPLEHPITAPTVAKDTLVVDRAGDADRLTFAGTAGQEVFVDLSASTLPDECGSVRLRDPSGTALPVGGCVTDGSGHLDRTVLPETGQYTVELAPDEPATGRLLVRVYEVADKTGTITPDARAETVELTHPGSVGRLTFTGRAGQTVFVDAPRSSLPDDRCDVLRLLGPDGKKLNTGCVVDGDGYVDPTPLAADGRYTVLIDPDDQSVGDTEVRLVVTHDQTGSIAVDGQPVRATVRQPGATSAFEFRGRAGQRIRVDATEGTLPDECGVVAVVGPGDKRVRAVCVISGTGTIDEVRLPGEGVYRVVVDPHDRATGGVTLRLTD
jgi:VWD domain-containing protein